jgi:hypothetical protein
LLAPIGATTRVWRGIIFQNICPVHVDAVLLSLVSDAATKTWCAMTLLAPLKLIREGNPVWCIYCGPCEGLLTCVCEQDLALCFGNAVARSLLHCCRHFRRLRRGYFSCICDCCGCFSYCLSDFSCFSYCRGCSRGIFCRCCRRRDIWCSRSRHELLFWSVDRCLAPEEPRRTSISSDPCTEYPVLWWRCQSSHER